jgi:putative restriction endonuclease
VQAAHIRPVAREGSDSVRNGMALSSTLHWMFDRGLISVGAEYDILVAKKGVPEPIQRLINPTGRVLLPDDRRQWPHQHYLNYHRENVFKG